jgi:uncharacterized protein YlxW (UPF0749 family)
MNITNDNNIIIKILLNNILEFVKQNNKLKENILNLEEEKKDLNNLNNNLTKINQKLNNEIIQLKEQITNLNNQNNELRLINELEQKHIAVGDFLFLHFFFSKRKKRKQNKVLPL